MKTLEDKPTKATPDVIGEQIPEKTNQDVRDYLLFGSLFFIALINIINAIIMLFE